MSLHPSVSFILEDQARMAKARNYFAWQGRLVMPELGQRVVEVGCGTGNFTGMLLDREMVVSIDIEPDCVERLQARYPNRPNLYTTCCDAGSAEFADLRRFRPDSCVCLNSLEHIEDDRGALAAMASITEPGGAIVLIVPAFEALYGPLDHNLGHYRRYTRQSMADLAAAAGLEVKTARYMNVAGFFGWWANSHLFRRESQSSGQIEFFDRFVAPIASRVEAAVPPPFGQSLFVALRKPSPDKLVNAPIWAS
ncbi:MAG: methyltransferase domain-containing protein [Bryobacteraceae bacterium]|jgi:SAM-dependent methyltransferase